MGSRKDDAGDTDVENRTVGSGCRNRRWCRGRSTERGRGTSLSTAQGSRGEVSLLSTNPAPQRRHNQTLQGFTLSTSASLPQTLGLCRQARGFFGGWTNHVKGQIVICHSCTNHVKGQIVIYHSCTNHVKGQVVMASLQQESMVITRCPRAQKSREPIKRFNKQLRLRPHLFCQAPS